MLKGPQDNIVVTPEKHRTRTPPTRRLWGAPCGIQPLPGYPGRGSNLQELTSVLGCCPFHQKAQTGVQKDKSRGASKGRECGMWNAALGSRVLKCPGKEGGWCDLGTLTHLPSMACLFRTPSAQHHTGNRADDPSPAKTGGPSSKDPQAIGPRVAGATQDTELAQALRDNQGRPGGGEGKGMPDSSHAWRWAQQGSRDSACH